MTVLAASGLAGGYPGRDVVHDVNLALQPGQITALIGPNGAGKTTLVRLLAGLLRPRAGSVSLRGRPLDQWPRREAARHIGLVPQLVEFAFPLSVEEVVGQGRAPHLGPWRPPGPDDRHAVADALDAVGMSAFRRASVRNLSGGERQLVLLARALATRPEILLLDEPAAALDVHHQLELARIVRERALQGATILLILHDWNLALRTAHRLVVMREGRIAADGEARATATPDLFEAVFGIRVELVERGDGVPIVVPCD